MLITVTSAYGDHDPMMSGRGSELAERRDYGT
jgi:hypothetical protein